MSDVVRIPLHKAHGVAAYALVDASDAWVGGWRWQLSNKGYAVTEKNGRTFWMQRVLLGLVHGDRRMADHINRDRLDNRRANLRIVDAAGNAQNRVFTTRNGKPIGHGRGAYRTKDRWFALVRIGGRSHHLGTYATEEEAARVAAEFRRRHMPFSVEASAAVQPSLFEDAA